MPKKIPMRTCIGCGAKKEKKDLIRVIRTPSGEITLDTTGRAQGRGAYICPDSACLEKAQKKHSLARALDAQIPEEIYRQLADQLAGAAQQ